MSLRQALPYSITYPLPRPPLQAKNKMEDTKRGDAVGQGRAVDGEQREDGFERLQVIKKHKT